MKRYQDHHYIIRSLIASLLLWTIIFAGKEIFPFGDKQIMVIDSWHQYYPFLQELHYKITNGESLFYTWRSGGGTNFYLLMTYYTMSPIYLAVRFFPKEYLREFMFLATMIKLSLASMLFSLYLKKTFEKNDASIVIFGLLYSFSAFNMAYYWNIMWLDAMMLLPIVVLGMQNIIDGKSGLLYTLILALVLISNFYTGYMVCLFLLIYFFILYFIKHEGTSFTQLIRTLLRVGIHSILAIGLAAFVLLPAYHGLQLAYSPPSGPPENLEVYFPFLDILNSMLIHAPPTIMEGLPNIYTGFSSVLLLISFFMLSKIPQKVKVLYLILIVFFLLSFNLNFLNYLWHGFRFPNDMPYRFTFIFSFVLVTIAYQAYLHLDEMLEEGNSKILKTAAFFMAYLLLCERFYQDLFDQNAFLMNMVFLGLYTGILLFSINRFISRKALMMILCIIIAGEIFVAAPFTIGAVGNSPRETYPSKNEAVQQSIAQLQETDQDFYRIEMTRRFTMNDPLLYGYPGLSQFSSTANDPYMAVARSLGLHAQGNIYVYTSSTPVVNAIYGIRYLIDREDHLMQNAVGYERILNETVQDSEEIKVYRNKYSLPFGFMVDHGMDDWETEDNDPFIVQESFIRQATGRKHSIYNEIAPDSEEHNHIEITDKKGLRHEYINIEAEKNKEAEVEFRYRIQQEGQHYLFLSAPRPYLAREKVEILMDGEEKEYELLMGRNTIDLGTLAEETEITVKFQMSDTETGYFDLKMASFDEEAFKKAYQKLNVEVLEITHHEVTRIEGTVQTGTGGRLYTSIPYEAGWTARVNGTITETVPLKNAMLTIPLPEGEHIVELTYFPPGLKAGIMISGISLLSLAGVYLVSRKKNWSKKTAKSEKEEETPANSTDQ